MRIGILTVLAVCIFLRLTPELSAATTTGIAPLGLDGKPLNLDFESGTLKDWTAEGNAFEQQPINGDTVSVRRSDMKSQHQGNFWIGTFERGGDDLTGTLNLGTLQSNAAMGQLPRLGWIVGKHTRRIDRCRLAKGHFQDFRLRQRESPTGRG